MMNMKAGGSRSKSKMRGFMCHSPASTAVCMAMDAGRSAIVPRRHDHHRTAATSTTALVLRNTRRDHEHASLINNKYNYYRPLRLDDRSALPVAVPVPVPVRHRLGNTTTAAAACDISADPSVFRNINDHPHMKLVKQMDDNNNNNYNKASSLDHLSHPPPTTSSTSDQLFQVVVMRVSLHCQGCAGKVKKHLSKMEGVTSFSVDLETKRVTVMGHVSPTGVLESISKVKKAEFWPQQPPHDQQLMIRSL